MPTSILPPHPNASQPLRRHAHCPNHHRALLTTPQHPFPQTPGHPPPSRVFPSPPIASFPQRHTLRGAPTARRYRI
eukprot:885056-Prorocentrum_lima.AAC.1